ncbi:MAG TPA: hypothetical protein VN903_03615 [Polyangia bacterium]|nr:hypothetical protein [Polyangia bacterium]
MLLTAMCMAAPALAHGGRGGGERGGGERGGGHQQQMQPQQRGGGGWRGSPAPQPPPPQRGPGPGGGWRGSAAPAPAPRGAGPGGGWRGSPAPAPARPMYAPPGRARNEARDWHRGGGWQRQGGWQRHGRWEEHRARDWRAEHRPWGQRGGYGGYYIPQARFERRFGPEHPFRIYSRPVIYEGYPRFSYGGSSFLIVDPWPESWPEDWYTRSDVYVGYDDGYYLYNRSDPSVALAITVMP